MRPGCYDSVARLEDMNRDGVLASLCFPSFPRFCGQTFYEANDRELAMKCVQAYNDWMIDEWCGLAPGRYIPMIILPLWDPTAGAAEIERCAAKGAKAITFSENPTPLGLPSIHARDRYWDPVFQAANDTGMPLCTHIGSSSQMPTTSKDAPMIVHISVQPVNLMLTTADWVFSGLFERFSDLKLCLSEGGIGWIPYLLEKLDWTWDRQRAWASKGHVTLDEAVAGMGDMAEAAEASAWSFDTPPSEIFRKHIYGCFIDEQFGVDVIDYIGIDERDDRDRLPAHRLDVARIRQHCGGAPQEPHTRGALPDPSGQRNARLQFRTSGAARLSQSSHEQSRAVRAPRRLATAASHAPMSRAGARPHLDHEREHHEHRRSCRHRHWRFVGPRSGHGACACGTRRASDRLRPQSACRVVG